MELHLATTIDRRSSFSSAVWSAAEEEAAALQPSAASQPTGIPTKRAATSTLAHSQPLSKKPRQAKSAAAAAAEVEGEDQEAADQSSVTESDNVVRGIILARQRQFLAASQQLPAAAVLRVGVDADIQQLEQYDQREMANELMMLWQLGCNKVSACAAGANARQDWLVLA